MASRSTYIMVDRNLRMWRWFKTPNTLQVWLWLLMSANIEDHDFQNETIHRGELATSRQAIMNATGLTEQQVRTALKHLKLTGEITVQQRANYQVISIVSYDIYQSQLTGKTTGNQPANNRLSTGQDPAINRLSTGKQPQSNNIISKEVKNEKNICVDPPATETQEKTPSANEVIGYFAAKGRSRQDADKFFLYNQGKGWRIGRTRITDWESVADMWIAGNPDTNPATGYDPHPELDDFGRPIQPKYK